MEESALYQPAYIDPEKCRALLWGGGYGRLQCGKKPEKGSDICGAHRRSGCPRGRATGPIPEEKLNEFGKQALKGEQPSKQFYSRQLMWHYAKELRSDLHFLTEVDEKGQWKLSDAEYELCLKRMQDNLGNNAKHGGRPGFVYKRGAGVRSRHDRGLAAEAGRYGAARERYNGEGGGKVFRWYSRAVFQNVLATMFAVTEETCTERQCMEALWAASEELRRYPAKRDRLKPFAGPQCFPHLDKEGGDYRGNANAPPPEELGEDGAGAPSAGTEARDLVDEENWYRCDRCTCWRFVGRTCLAALREAQYFAVRDTDLDWGTWLAAAPERDAVAFAENDARLGGRWPGEGAEELGGAAPAPPDSVEAAPGAAMAQRRAARRRVRGKSSERAVPAARGGDAARGGAAGRAARRAEAARAGEVQRTGCAGGACCSG